MVILTTGLGICVLGFQILWIQGYQINESGRKKWLEEDRPITKDLPTYPKGNFKSSDPDTNIRVFLNYVRNTLGSKVLVDVRSPKEFTGEILAPPEYPTEHAQRGGHIPGGSKYTLGAGSKRRWNF